MASNKKILANRKNSLKSTGPKTVNGKFKSSLNSIKHGLYAEKIAVIGENATKPLTIGGGSSELKAKNEISPLEGLQTRYKNATIIHAKGYASGPSQYDRVVEPTDDLQQLKKEAIEAASKADVVLFFGGLNKNQLQDWLVGNSYPMCWTRAKVEKHQKHILKLQIQK